MLTRIVAPLRRRINSGHPDLSLFEDALGVAALFLLLFAGLSIPALA